MSKRYPIRMDEQTKRELRHLAIDLGESVEKLAGKIFADAVRRARDEHRKH